MGSVRFRLVRRCAAFVVLAAALVGSGAPASFADVPAPRSQIRIGLSAPTTLDPGLPTSFAAAEVESHLFDGLVGQGQNGEIEPLLAESWDISEDGLTYTFHLREGMKWSDGEPITAADFEWAWKRTSTVQPGVGPGTGFLVSLTPILNAEAVAAGELDPQQLGVTALDDGTLVVTLAEPAAYFPALASVGRLYPLRQDVVEQFGEQWADPANIVTNGPYVLTALDPQTGIILERNEGYGGPTPQIQRIVYSFFPASAEALSAYERGELDVLGTSFAIPPSEAARLLADPAMGVLAYPLSATVLLPLNHRHPILGDPNVRRALGMAIDRDKLIAEVLPGYGLPAYSPQPWDIVGSNSDLWPGYDPEAARQLLEDIGFTRGPDGVWVDAGVRVPELTYTFSTAFNQRIGELLQQEWRRELGITLSLNRLEPEALDAWLDTSWEADGWTRAAGWSTDYGDPNAWYGTLWESEADPTKFNTGWRNDEFDLLVRQAAGEPDPELRALLYAGAEQILAEEYPVIPLFHPVGQTLVRPYVHGFQPQPIRGLLPLESVTVDSPLPVELQAAWEALYAAPLADGGDLLTFGEYTEQWLTVSGARIVVAPIEGHWSAYDWDTNVVTISDIAVGDIPAATGAVLVHQIEHARQRFEGTDTDCVGREVSALVREAFAWDALTNGGVAEAATPLQSRLNVLLELYRTGGEPGLYEVVAADPALQERCSVPTPN